MNDDQKRAAARAILENPLCVSFLDDLERVATDHCINADPKDDEKRAAFAAEVRAIRNFRRKLNLAIEEANAGVKRAPA